MYWIKEMQSAIAFMEDRLTEELTIEDIARSANSSSANFQRIFSIVTGMTVGDYIRSRRLSLAGNELQESDAKVLDMALKYGYETAESFTKAFTRFHGVTPSAAKQRKSVLKSFAPLSINIDIRGGFTMQRRLIPNVPEIKYDGNNASFFITLLEATLKSLGEDCDTAKLTALSGEGNRFCWADGKWVFGNELTQSINETPFETEYRVLPAIGWQAKYITVHRSKDGRYMNTDAAQIRRDFVSSIDKGLPVLIRYIEHADCDLNVFFGYEDAGQKIIGYDYNKGFEAGVSQPSDVTVPVTWDNWESNLAGYILLKNKKEAASERDTALSVLRFISDHARSTAEIRGRKIGFAAWESFLHHLEHDDFSQLALRASDAPSVNGVANSVEHRFYIYCDALCQIDARKKPLPYYRLLAERFPEWKNALEIAIQALDACASYGGFLWSQGFTFDEAGFEKFRSHEARKILADAGREAMRKDMLAVEQFEKILHV
jgi:AraC-like DNA-binding protein